MRYRAPRGRYMLTEVTRRYQIDKISARDLRVVGAVHTLRLHRVGEIQPYRRNVSLPA